MLDSSVFLLIVPYGIETDLFTDFAVVSVLLIVPYGIETAVVHSVAAVRGLLIVPYGIETAEPLLSDK